LNKIIPAALVCASLVSGLLATGATSAAQASVRPVTPAAVDSSGATDSSLPGFLSGTGSFTVKIDYRNDGKAAGSGSRSYVLEGQVEPAGDSCDSGREISVKNNTDFVLDTPTNGNVTGKRIDFLQSGSSSIFPGQTALYCVQFTQQNQVFDVRYDMSGGYARTADAAILIADAAGLNAGDSNDLANFVSAVAGIPSLQRIGACLGSFNPICAAQAINALMTNSRDRARLLGALQDYAEELGKSVTLKSIDKSIEKHLARHAMDVVTAGAWEIDFFRQWNLSPAGYIAFDTAASR
jgi:hypothetical protein